MTDQAQRTNLFKTKGIVEDKVSKIIIDNGSIDNLILEKVAAKLGLKMEDHLKPCTIGWIKNGKEFKLNIRAKFHCLLGRDTMT